MRPAAGGERIPVSTKGGFEPRWRQDGRELFYLTADRQIMAVDVQTTRGFEPGPPRSLFTAGFQALPAPMMVSNGYRKTYTVTPDGQRFLVNVLAREQNTQVMNVMLDWPTLLSGSSGK